MDIIIYVVMVAAIGIPYFILRMYYIKSPTPKDHPTAADNVEYNLLSNGDSCAFASWIITSFICLGLIIVFGIMVNLFKINVTGNVWITFLLFASQFIHYLVFRVLWSKHIHN